MLYQFIAKSRPTWLRTSAFSWSSVGWWMCKRRGITNQLFLEISYLLQNKYYMYIFILCLTSQYYILVNGESYFTNIIGKHIWYFIGLGGTLCSNNPHGNAKLIWTCGNPLDCESSIRGSQCQPLLNSTCDEGRQFWAPFVLGNPINQYISTCSKNQTLKWFPLPISIKWNLNRPVLHTMLQCYMYMMLSPHHFAPWLSRSRGATLLVIWGVPLSYGNPAINHPQMVALLLELGFPH